MSAPASDILITVPRQITLYFAIPTLVLGLIGGVFNIIVFLSLKTFRQSSCAFFLTVMSFVNIGQLLTALLSRIMITGFNNNWTDTSLAYCKFRNYCLQVCSLMSYTCMCLATIDQFLATSLRPRWQQCFTIRRAYLLCVTFFVIWLLHGIPSLIWLSPVLSPGSIGVSCSITNEVYQQYRNYGYTLVLVGVLPVLITVIFGCLAYWNVRQIPYRIVPLVRREQDKQLTSMVLVQVVHNFFVIVPYVSALIFVNSVTFTSQSRNYIDIILTNVVTGYIYYLYFASPFYIYVCVSKRFRQQLLHVLVGIYLKKWQGPVAAIGVNEISPQIA